MEKNIIIQEIHEYFTAQGHSFEEQRTSWNYSSSIILKKNSKGPTLSSQKMVQLLDNGMRKNQPLDIRDFDSQDRFNLFKHISQKYPEENLFNQLGYIDPNWCTKLELYLDFIYESQKEPLKKIKSIRTGLWSLFHDTSIEQIDDYISKRHTDAQIYDFYKGFLPQFQKNVANLKIGKFLLKKYNYDAHKLEPFSKYFNEVKNNFQTNDFDFFEIDYPYTKQFTISDSKIKKELQISFSLISQLQSFFQVLQKEKYFDNHKFLDINKAKQIKECIIYSRREIDLNAVLAESKKLFSLLYENREDISKNNYLYTSNLIASWLEKRALDNSLLISEPNNESSIKKVTNKL